MQKQMAVKQTFKMRLLSLRFFVILDSISTNNANIWYYKVDIEDYYYSCIQPLPVLICCRPMTRKQKKMLFQAIENRFSHISSTDNMARTFSMA